MKSQLEVKISFFQSCKDDDGGDHDNDNGDVNEVEEDDDDAVESKEAGHAWLTDRRSKPLTQEEKQADIIIINIFVNIIIINTRPWPAGLVSRLNTVTHASPSACGARLGLQL